MKIRLAAGMSLILAAPVAAQSLPCTLTHHCANLDACTPIEQAVTLVFRDTEADLVVESTVVATFGTVVTSQAGAARGGVTMTAYDPTSGGAVATLNVAGRFAMSEHYSGTEAVNTVTLHGVCDREAAQ